MSKPNRKPPRAGNKKHGNSIVRLPGGVTLEVPTLP
jgi:hypothetical protein